MDEFILIRYGELSLKKSNRKVFIKKINNHILKALQDFPLISFEAKGLRSYIHLNGTKPDEILEKLKKIPGLHSFSIVSRSKTDLEEIKQLALEVLKKYKKKFELSFKVETKRAVKTFPLTSLEISKAVASFLFSNLPGLKADMYHPSLILNLDVREEGTFIYCNSILGMGGFPSTSLGKALLMISGGIDSVVAGYLTLKKGASLEAIHFASPPYTNDLALQKVIDLVETLATFTMDQKIILHIVPFTELQQAIYQYAREDYGITLMRRMMYRISEKMADRIHAKVLVNGESIGQVASQTLESISVIEEVVDLPVIRPLATMDKQEIIDIATKLNTYEISIRPYEDCCTIFVPKHPQIKPLKSVARGEEGKFDFQNLLEKAFKTIKTIELTTEKHHQIFQEIPNNLL